MQDAERRKQKGPDGAGTISDCCIRDNAPYPKRREGQCDNEVEAIFDGAHWFPLFARILGILNLTATTSNGRSAGTHDV